MNKIIYTLSLFLLTGIQGLFAQASLYVLNPQNNWYWRTGRIEKATLSVEPAGAYFEMGLYLNFSSAGSDFTGDVQLETYMNFNLPEGSIVLDSWLWVDDEIVQGKIIDRWTASNIYEGIVNRRRDPSILMKNGQDNYELRVYPMKPGQQRKVKITYLVPAVWSNGKASIPIPGDILRASSVVPTLHTLVFNKEGWANPEIAELADLQFSPQSDPEFGSYYRLDIPDYQVEKSLSLRMVSPVTNGLFLSTVTDNKGESFYQLAVDLGQFVEKDEAVKMAILVDYEPANTNSDREMVFNTLQQYLLENYAATDSFNVFYSRYEIESYADTWMPVTPAALEAAFQPLVEGKTLYSNLPGLLSKGSQFVKTHQGGSLLLYSNADNYGSQEKANQLLRDVQSMQTGAIHIADFQNQNYTTHRIGSQWYYGQEYFFLNLSRISGGEFERIRNHSTLVALCSDVFGSLTGSITAFDLYSSAQDGFCYARYNRSNQESYHPGEYFVQTGRFMGGSPFTLYLTGMFDGEPFNQLIQVEQNQLVAGDSLLAKSWYGQHIRDLEWSAGTNEQVNNVIAESIEQRVLSRYTAFLSLEPSDTVPVCTSCQDESRLTWINASDWAESDSVSVYPNPCSDFVTIRMASDANLSGSSISLEIYSVLGTKVFEANPDVSGGNWEYRWDLTASDGQKVAKGLYFITLTNQEKTLRKTLIVN